MINRTWRTRLLAIALLNIIALVRIAEGVEAPSPASPNPLDFYPTSKGLSLEFESTLLKGDRAIAENTTYWTYVDDVLFEGEAARLVEFVIERRGPGEKLQRNGMEYLQKVDSEESYTVAYRSPTGEYIPEDNKYLDLYGELVEGASWEFVCSMPFYEGSGNYRADFACRLSVEATGVSVVTPGGEFSDCILILEQCRSLSPVSVDCPEPGLSEALVYVERKRYWAPANGQIKETSTEWYGHPRLSESCVSYSYSTVLTKVVGPGE